MPRRSSAVAVALALAAFAPALPVVAGGALPIGGSCPWVGAASSAGDRADAVLSRMTLRDEVAMVHGVGSPIKAGAYAGSVAANPRLCIPALHFADGAAGVANGITGVTQLPAPVALASSWDPQLATRYGRVVGDQSRGKGVEVNLGPTLNIVRDPRWGRAFESYGEDPYLSGELGAAYVQGVQGTGVMAEVKHLAAYNQETNRNHPADNAVVSRRALEELYLPQFEAAVRRGHAAAVMCAYSTVNGEPACQNQVLLNALKRQWGFDGFVTSDWFASFFAAPAANAGLDLEMPTGARFGASLRDAVTSGIVLRARLDDMVRRILVSMFRFGLFDRRPSGSLSTKVTSDSDAAIARSVAAKGMVLLKNQDGVLPLGGGSTRSLAVIGADARSATLTNGGGSAAVVAQTKVSPLRALRARATRDNVKVRAPAGHLSRSRDELRRQAVKIARRSDAAVIFVGKYEEESADLANIDLPSDLNDLIADVARVNPRTIVVLNTGSAVEMPWLGSVAAVLEAWYPGQEGAAATASVLFGDVNPSGKLPVTFPRTLADVPAATTAQWPGANGSVAYSEDLLVGYRWYAARGVPPQFPFGFGLSYTSFDFHNLRVRERPDASGKVVIHVDVANRGRRAGAEVVQVYVAHPEGTGEPPWQLQAFRRVTLRPGEARRVALTLDERAFASWDDARGAWETPAGVYRIAVGDSSANLPLTMDLTRE
jgi:beta-glucosidase